MKKIVFTFGRFNPPTTGHLLLATKVKEEARRRGADYKIYGSNTKDPKRNPLSAVDKSRFMKKVLKDTNIVVNKDSGNPYAVLQQLSKDGYTDVTMVVGADRVPEFKNGMKKYIGKKGYENIANFDVISAGERDPDAEGIEGMSASKMRAAAAEGNLNAFKLGMPSHVSDADRLKLFKAVRKGMGIRGNIKESWFDYDEFVEFAENYNQLDEISVQTRRKMARTAKRTAKIRARKRKLKEKRRKGKKELVKKANKAAIAKVRAKLIRGMKWKDVPFMQREKIDAKIKKKKKRIAAIAKKLMPTMQKQEKERLAQVRARMTATEPSKAVESVDYNFETEVLNEYTSQMRKAEQENIAKQREQEKYGTEVIALRTADGKVLIMTAGDAKAGEKAGTHKITNTKPNKGAMDSASKDDNFECTTTSKNLGVNCPEGKDSTATTGPASAPAPSKVKPEISPEEKKLQKKEIELASKDADAKIAEYDNAENEEIKAELTAKMQKQVDRLMKKKPKGKAKYPTDFDAVDVEAGIVDHINLHFNNGYDGDISKSDRNKIDSSITMSQAKAEMYGIEEGSVAKRVFEQPGGIKDFMDANSKGELGDENEEYTWKAIHAGKKIPGEKKQGISKYWKSHAPRSGPTSKSDIILVRTDSKGREKRYGVSVKAGPSRLISSAPGEAVAMFEMARGMLKEKCGSDINCQSTMGMDKETHELVEGIVQDLTNRQKTHLRTGVGVGPLGWFTEGGAYRCAGCNENTGPKWWDVSGPGANGVSWSSVYGQAPKPEHWEGTDISKYHPEIVNQIKEGNAFHKDLAKRINTVFNNNKQFKEILFTEAATGCCKFCGCCSTGCNCGCNTSKVAEYMLTMSADGTNVAMNDLRKGTDAGKATVNKIMEKSDTAFSWKTGQKEKKLKAYAKELGISVEELMKRTGKGEGSGLKLGDYQGYAALQVHTKESMDSFAHHQGLILEEISKDEAMQLFKQDVDAGKEIAAQNFKELDNVKGDPLKLIDHLGWDVEDMESSEIEDWSDIGLEQDSEETTEIKVHGEKGSKTHRVSVLKHREENEEKEEGLALSPEEENALFNEEFNLFVEDAPEGWEGTVKAMKKDKSIDNPFALAHWMKNKGYKSRKPVTDSYEFKESSVHGLGSFSTRDIKAGEEISLYYLNLLEDIPTYQRTDFCRWTNHSHINENISLLENNGNFTAHALKEIKEGEELFIDYFYVLETILSKIGNTGQVIDEVIRWTDGYDHIKIEEDNGTWKTLLNYFIEQGDCPNFIHESQFYEEVILALPDYPNQRKIYDKDLFDSKLGRDDWELGDPTKPLGLHQIKEDEDPVKRAKRLKKYNATPEQRKRRSARTNERNKRIRKGQLAVGDGKDIDHKDGNPMNNSASNISITSQKYNRGRNNNKGRTEEHGAGEEGTKKLLKRYLKDTPYMTINDKFSKEL
tara:strand:- start:6354 stop:10658 length:4305 start_codon:yes stop_codon:yes gene_type:complete